MELLSRCFLFFLNNKLNNGLNGGDCTSKIIELISFLKTCFKKWALQQDSGVTGEYIWSPMSFQKIKNKNNSIIWIIFEKKNAAIIKKIGPKLSQFDFDMAGSTPAIKQKKNIVSKTRCRLVVINPIYKIWAKGLKKFEHF